MPKIVIVSGIQPSNNPRVVKEADALAAAGFEVEVLGSILSESDAHRQRMLYESKGWKFTAVVDNQSNSRVKRLSWFWLRFRSRLWSECYARFGIHHVAQLGYAGPELFRICRYRKADLFSIHLEQAMWVGIKLLELARRVSVDFEDWYSEDLLPKDRTYRPVRLLRHCESTLHNFAVFKTTTSESLADALLQEFGGNRSHVIPNTFAWRERELLDGRSIDRKDRSRLSLFWFSQTIGPQRGLEDLLQATHHVSSDLEIHLRGNCSEKYRQSLIDLVAPHLEQHVYFHDQVPHHELLARIAEHDIGFAGETAYCPSRDLTITNKVLQYMLAGIPVVASDTSGQREVQAACPDGLVLYKPGDAIALASAIDRWADKMLRAKAARAVLQTAKDTFCWEKTSSKLVEVFREAIESRDYGLR